MIEVDGYFNELHFTECMFDKFTFEKNKLIVHIEKGLGVMGDHPLIINNSEFFIGNCQLIFEEVCFSERRIHEYIGDPQKGNFKPTEKIIDMPFQPRDDSYKVFEIEGIFNNPMSWIDWTIKAKRFKLKVKDII